MVAELNANGEPIDVRGCDSTLLQPVFDALPVSGEVPVCKGVIASHLHGGGVFNLTKSAVGDRLPVMVDGPLILDFSQVAGIDLHAASVRGRLSLDKVRCRWLKAKEVSCDDGISGEQIELDGELTLVEARAKCVHLPFLVASRCDLSLLATSQDLGLGGARVEKILLPVARIGGSADLSGRAEVDSLDMPGARIGGDLDLGSRSFSRQAELDRVEIAGQLKLPDCTFRSKASFRGVKVKGGIQCQRTKFLELTDFGDAEIGGAEADLEALSAESRVDLRLTCRAVNLSRAHFRDGLDLRLGDSAVRLDGTRFDAVSLISGPQLQRASLVSLRGARLSNLALAHIDLSNCLMEGSAELDQLKLGDGISFPRAPQPVIGKYGVRGRQVIADEIEWRQREKPKSTWNTLPRPAEQHPVSLQSTRYAELAAAEIEELYRSLRIAREGSGNSPGAADFYYGEMEMRRKLPWSRGWAEKVIVWLYWAVSGYGLRASRALGALLALWALGCFFFLQLGGFVHSPPVAEAAVFTISSGLSFLHEPPGNLSVSTAGEAAQLLLKIGTAILLALATLALRGRVKR